MTFTLATTGHDNFKRCFKERNVSFIENALKEMQMPRVGIGVLEIEVGRKMSRLNSGHWASYHTHLPHIQRPLASRLGATPLSSAANLSLPMLPRPKSPH